ncbi:MAG TPA: hypothetical protein VLF69_02635 [Candidatus Saccharimonadales bacterium]|nr:hypothetical protein [Candidatus Saccharimonadales bacterium]
MSKLQSVGSVAGKETIYVDVDDEITAIIDKVQSAKGKVVALVLPKRCTVLQSIVNMKLLKRTADTAQKNLVLVTTENGLMPLAGAVGLHVASTPNSRPEVPAAPAGPGSEPEDADQPLKIVDGTADEGDDYNPKAAAGRSVGELAAAGAAGKIAADDVEEDIDMNEEDDGAGDDTVAPLIKPIKNKKLAIPNFDSFRKKLALGILGVIILIVGWIFAFIILPKAAVAIKTDNSTIATNLNLTLDTTAKAIDPTNNILPATAQTQQKTDTQQVAATGQQNIGTKATGNVTMTAQKCGGNPFVAPDDVPAGTTISTGGHTYTIQANVSFHGTGASGSCYNYAGNGHVDITALKGGTDYNVSSATFTVTGRSDASASGSASGGTDNVIKVVSQSDIDDATAKIKGADTATLKQQLISALQAKGLQAIPVTFLAGDPQVTTNAQAGDQADTVTVTAVTSFTMLGVQKTVLTSLVEANVNKQLDKGKQVILDDGVANAKFGEQSPGSATGAVVQMSTKSVAGPHIDIAQLKTQIMGMKSGDVKSFIKQTPGVTSVQVKFSPLWVNAIPKKADKITITLDKSGS